MRVFPWSDSRQARDFYRHAYPEGEGPIGSGETVHFLVANEGNSTIEWIAATDPLCAVRFFTQGGREMLVSAGTQRCDALATTRLLPGNETDLGKWDLRECTDLGLCRQGGSWKAVLGGVVAELDVYAPDQAGRPHARVAFDIEA